MRQKQTRGFTLIELMVAMALGTILTGAIVFIFVQSQKIISEMDAKVQVYNYGRNCMDVIERDLANAVKTADMEFFQDGSQGNVGHYEPSTGDSEAIPVRDEGQIPHQLFGANEKYIYAMTLTQPEPYLDFNGQAHRWDSLYFRTVTSVNGQTRPVLVEYALDVFRKSNPTNPRKLPRLVRRHWIVTEVAQAGAGGGPRLTLNGNAGPNVGPNEPIETELCLYVTDFQVEFFMQDKRTGRPGRFMSAEEISAVRPGGNPNYPDIRQRDFGPPPGLGKQAKRVSCFYDYRHSPTGQPDIATYDLERGLLTTNENYHFPMLEPGDRLFYFDTSDPVNLLPGDLTVKSIEKFSPTAGGSPTQWGVRFVESLPTNLTTNPTMKYRVGFLPPMVRVTLKIKDEKGDAVRTLVRQFKLLGA